MNDEEVLKTIPDSAAIPPERIKKPGRPVAVIVAICVVVLAAIVFAIVKIVG